MDLNLKKYLQGLLINFFEISPGKYREISEKIKLEGRVSILGLKV